MKKLLALLLVLSMSVSLAACGGNKTEEPAASGGNASEDASGEADADGGAQATAGDDLTWGLTPSGILHRISIVLSVPVRGQPGRV